MKVITIDITEGGKAICSNTNLGRAGEHNNTKFHIIMVDEELRGCDYYRCWFGNKYSTELIADNSQIMFTIPQDALIPPTVEFQLCGYKANNGEAYVIARSSILTFIVEESACCTLLSDQAFEPFEILVHDCESAAKSAKSSEASAKNSASQAHDFCNAAIDAVNRFDEFKNKLDLKADAVTGQQDQYIGFLQDGTDAEAISPDYAPINNSTNLITSGGVYNAIKDKASMDYVAQNYLPVETFDQQMSKKQNKLLGYEGQYVGFMGIVSSEAEVLTPDWLPQKDSDMLITSGGVYEAIGNIETVLDGIIAIQNALIGGDGE